MLSQLFHKIAAETQGPPVKYRRRPSSAGPERCIRSMVYHAMGTEAQPFPGRAMMIFDDSSWHEELTNDWIRKTAFRLHSEHMKIDTAVGPGELDGIITDLLGVDRVYEHKAINHFGFQRIWGGDWPLDYFTQTALYMQGVQRLQPELFEGILLIKNKNTAQYMDFLLQYMAETDTLVVAKAERSDGEEIEIGLEIPRIIQSAVEKFDNVDAYVAAGKLPERPFELGTDFPCGYCRWGRLCWESFEKEFAELRTGADLPAEIADKIRFYQELGAQCREAESQRKEVGQDIKKTMIAAGARKGRAGEYLIEVRLQKAVSYESSRLPEKTRAAIRQESPYERIYIKKQEVSE